MLVKKARVFPVECVVRGYLAGSGWAEYKEKGTVCGMRLPGNLQESARLPEPLFTPSTKAEQGHDENISFDRAGEILGEGTAEELKRLSISMYKEASRIAEEKGIIIADTKFEFGSVEGETIVVDEVLTPDSSRFWSAGRYKPGEPQDSFDKQIVRDYLNGLPWDKTYPGPELPPAIVDKAALRYREIFEILTGSLLE
jgi:phosphoribosylaminoimidazole-succinocarboxamide synthase